MQRVSLIPSFTLNLVPAAIPVSTRVAPVGHVVLPHLVYTAPPGCDPESPFSPGGPGGPCTCGMPLAPLTTTVQVLATTEATTDRANTKMSTLGIILSA